MTKTKKPPQTKKRAVEPQPLGWDKVINERYDPAVPIGAIRPHPKNPRAGDIGAISQSITHNGFYGACVVQQSTGYILVGNHRHQAAAHEGAETLPVIWVDCNDEVARRILISDNRANDLAGYDNQALAELLESIRSEQGDFTGTLYDQEDYDRLLSDLANGYVSGLSRDEIRGQELASPNATVKTGNCDDDETPEPEEEPVSRLGDLWICGDHRVLCGDSTDKEQVARLMDGQKADMVFTDPPYNADYSSRVDKNRRKPWGGILNDNIAPDQFDIFLFDVMAMLLSCMKDGASIYACIDWKRYPQIVTPFADAFKHKCLIVWDKTHFGLGTYYRTQHELILFGIKGETIAVWNADHDERDVWSLKREPTSSYVHPTQKPVELVMRAVANSSHIEEVVLDLFGGSGTTLIACEKHSRRARLMELDPKYCDVIAKRFQTFSGTCATLDSDGRTFDDIALERRALVPATA